MDFILHGGPEDFLLTPLTDGAKRWVLLHSEDDAKRLGFSVLILRDHLDGILQRIVDDGLAVEDEAARLQVDFRSK
jgi:hypothetical protein